MISRRLLWTALLAACLLAIAAPQNQRRSGTTSVHPLLAKAFRAQRTLKFAGIRSVEVSRSGRKIKFQQRIVRNGRKVRVEFVDGPFANQILVEDGETRLHYIPARKIIKEGRADRDELMFGLLGMSRYRGRDLKVSVKDGGSIAGVKAKLATLAASGRTREHLWIDEDKGLVLKKKVYSEKGEVTGSYAYTRLTYSPRLTDATFQLNISGAKRVTLDEQLISHAKSVGISPYRLKTSTGYKLISVMPIDSERAKGLIQSYTSGRNRVTLFVMKGAFDEAQLRKRAGDRTRVVTWARSGLNFALIGEVSSEELTRLSRSLKT